MQFNFIFVSETNIISLHSSLQGNYERGQLVTYFHVRKKQNIDGSTLNSWREDHLDEDDVFHPEFLKEIVFGGIHPDGISLTRDAKKVLERWQTRAIRYEPDLSIESGRYFICNGMVYSIRKVLEDYQHAFVQSI